MTKAELIKELEHYPDDMEIFWCELSEDDYGNRNREFFQLVENVSRKLVTDVGGRDYQKYLGDLVIALE
jgi:hypothetical protein